ncbi:MAG: hypothetical protein QM639_10715 [Rhodocyclaceae bacterium]
MTHTANRLTEETEAREAVSPPSEPQPDLPADEPRRLVVRTHSKPFVEGENPGLPDIFPCR